MKKISTYWMSLVMAIFFLATGSIQAQQDPSFIAQSAKQQSDGTIQLTFTISLDEGWYMYGTQAIPNGPLPVSADFTPSADYELVGTLTETTPTHTKYDAGFGLNVEIFEGQAVLVQTIRPLTDKDFKVLATLSYQTCNGQECLTADKDVTFKVRGSSAAATPASTNEKSSEQSLWMFLLVAFAAGLGGVITPCVFPMIPMTVGFFMGNGNSKTGPLKGIVFGLSVTLIYTALGLIVSLFQSTAATDALGTHWIPNLLFALLFIVFAISFLGAFEITLPSSLANKADRQADKGGFLAAFFVALAMVIVSFSCTGPFVGSILAAAVVDGVALKPILGMAAFGLAFSLPFVVFSFFPNIMKKMPKSGGWLNVVKVVFAFVLMAFSVKFLYNVDAYFGWGIISRTGFLAVWIVLATLLGAYFLGKIQTHHDSPVSSLGWGRLVGAMICFVFALYLFTGLLGAPLQTISGMLPPQESNVQVVLPDNTSTVVTHETAATFNAYRSLPSFNNIEDALAEAQKSDKKVFLYFKSHTCSVCKVMEATVLNNPDVLQLLASNYVIANLYVDDKTPDATEKTLGRRLRKYQTTHYGIASQPLYVVTDANGNALKTPVGNSPLEAFINFLQ
ncbi:MAG: thioredoxin family protein [Bacteroidales bacterium]|nr:thioredoxin family protein [Bacteroidales bacterium]